MNKSKTLALLLSMTMLFSACGSAKTDNKAGDSKEATVGETTGEGTAAGHNGDLKAVVTFDGDKIAKIDLTHEETEGLGDKAADKLVEEIVANNSINVDTVSGATVTSTAVIEAVKAAIVASGRDVKNFEAKGEAKKGETVEKDTDVVVIGGGGAGFAAAVSAKEAGANVILVEKLASVGGNTLISGGEYAAPANDIQKEEGIEDSKELFAKDVEEAGGNPELIKVLADKATEDAYWLRDDIGVEWLDSLMFFGGHSVKRSLIPAAHTGNELIKNYLKKAEELGIEVLTETDVKEILSKDGKVCGIKAETKDGELIVNSKSVVVASGGFGANAEMCYENDKEVDEHVLSTNSPGATGDGITMAEKLGADTVDMDKIQLYPVCDVETGKLLYCGDTRLVGGALLVNKEGKRFVEELGTRREISMAIKAQTDYVGYVLWDETSNEKTGTMKSNPEEAKSLFDRGLMVKADTLEELADHFGIDKDALLETVKTFNENSAKKEDPEFNLRMLGWQVKDAPFYMMKAAPAVHHTMGGLKINTDAQVLNKDGEWIDGLYAAGEVTGGIHGSNRLGSVAMADITVFGKIAGENAAANAKK
ncbi:flavocytochrome c [Anaerococcus degeneri]|uniref:Urocanate reductase n=1 Tax=Anaerococcus degeneri TaxID=361500 RepID=A0ABS7YYI8_9FIRM|nr:flavocytochrome c [Anaerococcus degeneri]MBP2014569.1 urocanate reductase [Anaerococcus degeneri]MCA2096782.1 flavocytochrome c [Anaerococcus degeneri]